jgi:hypothetical protein
MHVSRFGNLFSRIVIDSSGLIHTRNGPRPLPSGDFDDYLIRRHRKGGSYSYLLRSGISDIVEGEKLALPSALPCKCLSGPELASWIKLLMED